MFRNPRRVFLLLLVLAALVSFIDLPAGYRLNFAVGPVRVDKLIPAPVVSFRFLGIDINKEFKTRLGLDLSGGTHLVLEADMQNVAPQDRTEALGSAHEVIERRVNLYGVAEPVVQTSVTNESYRIIVELPGVTNVDEAQALIGQTARLEFREFTNFAQATLSATPQELFAATAGVGITGADLKRAQVVFSPETGDPQVGISFTPEGTKKFEEVTRRLVGQPLAIFLDDVLLSAPTVQNVIQGDGVITGSFTRKEAQTLALQLNAGALPVPVHVVEKRTIGATLGEASIEKSIRAGAVGLGAVALFMILQYGWLGLIANMALLLYGLLSLALIRILGITLTLPGIAGFILAIGMAVDSNILIFERYKEEVRSGATGSIGMELAFGKAWDSIRDANLTTIITAIILFNPSNWSILPSSGLVRGFAATLLIGVVTSLFTGIVATRTFIRVLYRDVRDK